MVYRVWVGLWFRLELVGSWLFLSLLFLGHSAQYTTLHSIRVGFA